MLRAVVMVALVGYAAAFAAAPSALPSLRRAGAQCSAVVMKSEQDIAAESLSKRRMVVGGLFALLAPLTGLPTDADAARSGGRVGGGSFRPKAAPSGGGRTPVRARAAPAPTVINRPSVTVIQSAPSMPFGGYGGGYGRGMFGGGMFGGGGYGYGISTSQFIGLSALELASSIQRENRRQAYLQQQLQVQQQLGKDQAQIDMLSKQLAETNAKMSAMADVQKQAK